MQYSCILDLRLCKTQSLAYRMFMHLIDYLTNGYQSLYDDVSPSQPPVEKLSRRFSRESWASVKQQNLKIAFLEYSLNKPLLLASLMGYLGFISFAVNMLLSMNMQVRVVVLVSKWSVTSWYPNFLVDLAK